jgi:hypothetical protein
MSVYTSIPVKIKEVAEGALDSLGDVFFSEKTAETIKTKIPTAIKNSMQRIGNFGKPQKHQTTQVQRGYAPQLSAFNIDAEEVRRGTGSWRRHESYDMMDKMLNTMFTRGRRRK